MNAPDAKIAAGTPVPAAPVSEVAGDDRVPVSPRVDAGLPAASDTPASYETPHYTRSWDGVQRRHTSAPNPTVEVSARNDRVLYGPRGEVISRIIDRPIGFRR